MCFISFIVNVMFSQINFKISFLVYFVSDLIIPALYVITMFISTICNTGKLCYVTCKILSIGLVFCDIIPKYYCDYDCVKQLSFPSPCHTTT